MNDYFFGNRLLRLRTEAGLTQAELGRLAGVSGKAVSKWETGKAKPGTEALRKLSAILRVPVEELLRLRDESGPAAVHKIVVTGGPCAGKTTAMSWIQNAFTKQGYAVLFVPETATELISGGVAPWTCGSNLDYQRCQVALQLEKERIFRQAAGWRSSRPTSSPPTAKRCASASAAQTAATSTTRPSSARSAPGSGWRSSGG